MLYSLVNNDYQLQALRRHGIASLGGDAGVCLLTVPHALTASLVPGEFRSVHRFVTPLGRHRMPALLWAYVNAASRVREQLHPKPGDTLLFFTEVEWLNQIIVAHFRRHGARVVLMEDGGFATYIPMSVEQGEPLTRLERWTQAAFRCLPGLRQSRLFKVNGQVFPRLPDDAIDTIALYQDVTLKRQTPSIRVAKPPRLACAIRAGRVVFLNERMYDHYQSEQSYLLGLARLMTALSAGFSEVFFKFHPRESEDWKQRIRDLLQKSFPSVQIIDRPGTIEEMVLDYRPEVLASYFSAGLLSIAYEGIEPLYLYHLGEDLVDQPVFQIATRMLSSWGYCFVPDLASVRAGYRSGIMGHTPPAVPALQAVLAGPNVSEAEGQHPS